MKKKLWLKALGGVMTLSVAASAVPLNVQAESEINEIPSYDYSLVWSDEFDGDSLNTDDWNVEEHEPGWVNSEKQRYTSLDEGNIVVRDGSLFIKPHYNGPVVGSDEATEEGTPDDEEESGIEEGANDSDNPEEGSQEAEKDEYDLSEADRQRFEFDAFVDSLPTSETITVQVNFGKVGNQPEGIATGKVLISDLSLIEVFEDGRESEEMLINPSLNGGESWSFGVNAPGAGNIEYIDDAAVITIDNSGDENWHIQLQQGGLKFEQGHHYRFRMNAASEVNRAVEISLLDPENGYKWYAGSTMYIEGSAPVDTEGDDSENGSGNNSGEGTSAEDGQEQNEKVEITSGRITTQGKHDFTYGRFEARAKVPAGQGYLPAFWLMATDEGLYGQWPRCGEIDIMEVMGQNTSKSYHTIHYGYNSGNGHKENQGNKVLSDSSFSDDFHVFRVDWDPGKITWYVDDEQVYSTSDWYTGQDDNNQVTYPAPFDQDFYVILNLAVGGSWVGNPNDDTLAAMNDQAYEIDYVRVYQKPAEAYEMEENGATRPESTPVTYREQDESGNYVINGDFSSEIGMDSDTEASSDNWKFHVESDAQESGYSISEEGITITPSAAGGKDYSIQLKQENIPMYRGWEYKLSFEAASTEERDIIVDVEGPNKGWIRYLNDTRVSIGPEKSLYELTFTMNEKNDPNGCLEFNLGNLGSTAPVTIDNVRLEYNSGEEVAEDTSKAIGPDGNYLYNGGFDQGTGRLGYWEYSEEDAGNISVTNVKNRRELKVVVPEGKTVTVGQSELSPLGTGKYEIRFSGRMEEGSAADGVSVDVAGDVFVPALTTENASYSKKIDITENLGRSGSYVNISFTKPGTYYIDNIFLGEASLIKNGSFNAGLAGFSPYIYDSVKANYVVDSMQNDNAFAITIEDTVAETNDNAWYVQLNQDGVNLEQGKKYCVSFKAKSSIERKITYALQEFEGNWTNYSGTGAEDINSEWKTFTHEFVMNYPTDPNTRFNITMGSIDGVRITQKHDVFIDDISLVEVTDETSEDPNTGENGEENSGENQGENQDPGQGSNQGGNQEPNPGTTQSENQSGDQNNTPAATPSSGTAAEATGAAENNEATGSGNITENTSGNASGSTPVSNTDNAAKTPSEGTTQIADEGTAQAPTVQTQDGQSAKSKKAKNTLKVKGKKATVKYSKLVNKAQKVKLGSVLKISGAKGKVTYSKVKGNKKITINKKSGKVTVAKGLSKGTYSVKVKVSAAGNKKYQSGSKTVTFKIRVK